MLNSQNYFEELHNVPMFFKFLPLILAMIGSFIAFVIYFIGRVDLSRRFVENSPRIYSFLVNKWYFDEIYNYIFVIPYKKLSSFCWKKCDVRIIDNWGPNALASFSINAARLLVPLQNGYIYRYAYVMIVGIVLLTGYFYI